MVVNSSRLTLFCTSLFVLLIVVGCDRTEEIISGPQANKASTTRLTSGKVSATEILDQCIKRYSQASSYQDQGQVRLRYTLDGTNLEDMAPLAIAFERPNRLGIKAYRVTAGVTQDRWRMRIGDDEDSPTPKQIVSRNLPDWATLEWLKSDSVAMQYLSAGMAGIPPQLDLLLDPSPMKGLIDESATISLGGAEMIADRSCYVISVVRAKAEYRLWIDQADWLVRRMELPQSKLPPEMLQDKRVQQISLSLEFNHARFDHPVDWKLWSVAEFTGQQLVSHFVVPPPPLPTALLGKKIPAFRLNSSTGAEVVNTGAVAGEKTHVLLWLADHPASRASADQLAVVARNLPTSWRDKVNITAVWAEPNPPRGRTLANIGETWNLPMSVAIDTQAVGRDVFAIAEAPALVVLDSENRLQIMEERGNPLLAQMLPGILERIVAGENLAERIVEDARVDQDRFDSELWMASAIDAAAESFEPTRKFAPRFMKLNLANRNQTAQEILALAGDHRQLMWVLREDGRIEHTDAAGQIKQSHETNWKFSKNANVRLQVSTHGQFVAAFSHDSGRIDLFEIAAQRKQVVQLAANQRIVDIAWLAANEVQSPRLLVLTSDRQTLLIDPSSQQQLSGLCQADPVAILPQTDSFDGRNSRGLVVLADRRVEPLVIDGQPETPNAGKPALVKSASHATGVSEKSSRLSPSRLQFQPGTGPWNCWSDSRGQAILAHGWIARNEPAVFLLDKDLRQQWHYRIPLTRGDTAPPITAATRDPISGQPMFLITQPNQTIHILRADGQVSDHLQLDQPIRGLALIPVGDQLNLIVAHPRSLDQYAVSPR